MMGQITPFPGHRAARNALTDPKTADEIRAIAADMVGDVELGDITMMARGADWTEPPPRVAYRCEPDDNRGADMLGALSAVLIFMMGWVAGLLTVLFTIQ